MFIEVSTKTWTEDDHLEDLEIDGSSYPLNKTHLYNCLRNGLI